jgi:hypothetical protein
VECAKALYLNGPISCLTRTPVISICLLSSSDRTIPISRKDETQAQVDADELHLLLPAKPIHVAIIGGRRVAKSNPQNDPPNMRVWSYADLISRSRYEVQWLIKNAAATH